jgi:fructosamine-3-kinase
MNPLETIRDLIAEATGTRPTGPAKPISGGCINDTYALDDYFIKTNRPHLADMFAAEAEGLTTLAATETVRVPEVICQGADRNSSFLVLELLPLGPLSTGSQQCLGQQLAGLHHTTASTFGGHRDNYIGSTPQRNQPTANWIDFLREQRLEPLIRALHEQGAILRQGEQLLDGLPRFFPDELPPPSLLHGDLWGGNAAALPDGTPVLFDPAAYFGDREADLAMTRLFGGFSDPFYAAYTERWPLPPGNEARSTLYNLYHILNHALLFGDSYRHQAQAMIDQLVAS